jgi:homogentisate 1,2-dioxygenase
MNQQVIISATSAVDLKPLLESAIRSEVRVLELGVARTLHRLKAFEQQYQLSSDTFERQFLSGQQAETLDFIEWAGELKTYRLLLAQLEALKGLHVN